MEETHFLIYVYTKRFPKNRFSGEAKRNQYKTSASKFHLTFEIEDYGSTMSLYLNYEYFSF